MRDARLSIEARERHLKRRLRRELRYLGYDVDPHAELEQLMRDFKAAIADLMRPGGRR